LRLLLRDAVPTLRRLVAQTREGSLTPRRMRKLRLPKSAFRVVAVAFWAATTARVLATYSGPGLHVTSLSVWVIPAVGFLLGILLWILPLIRIPAEQLFGSIVIGIALPLLYLSVVGNARSRDLLPILGAAAVFTAVLLPLRTAMAAALLGAVAAAIPLLAGWSGYYDRSLLILVSVIGLLTYVQARMMGTLGTDKRRVEAERRQIEESYVATISALAASIFAKEGSAEAHSRGSAALAVAVARRLGLRKRQLQLLEYAAVLQDVGKVGLPGYVLSKPGKLSDDELTMIRQHPVIAERILSVVPALAGITPVIRAQYERWNGSGYPDGLAGRAIPLGARILHVCTAYHAMTTDRPYRPALSQDEILAELRAQAGKQFDPRVVDALTAVLRAGEVEAISYRAPADGQSSTPREWVQQLETLEGLGNRLGSENSIEHICRAVTETMTAMVPNDQCGILLLREEDQRLVPAYLSRSERAESAEMPPVQEVAVGEGIAGSVAETKRGIVVGDANQHPKASQASKVHESMLAAPVVFKRELLGVVVVSKLGLNQYTGDHLRLLSILTNQLGASLANARMIERLGQARGPQQTAA
jgi:putative methionine-R-sulfoxide reductase with GAF domain